MQKRFYIVNFRVLFVLAVALVLAVISAYLELFGAVELKYALIMVYTLLGLGLLFAFGRITKYFMTAVIALCLLFVMPIQIDRTIQGHTADFHRLTEAGGEVEIVGTTSDMIAFDGASVDVWLEKVYINGERVSGKLDLSVNSALSLYPLKAGTQFSFRARLYPVELLNDDSLNVYAFKNNISMSASVNASAVVVSEGSATFFSAVRGKLKDVLFANLDEDVAAMSFAMFTGDRTTLAQSIESSFRASGITHLLSVSGLHVVFLCVALNFLLDKVLRLKSRRVIKLLCYLTALALYCCLCGLSPSVVRASIMALVYMISKTFFFRYDGINSYSISALIILLAAPLMLFDIGFQLSYAAVLGLICFGRRFARLFKRVLRFDKLSSVAAMTVSAQLTTIPIIAGYFRTFPVYSLLSNVLVVPLAEIGFISQIFGTLIVLIIPQLGFILKVVSIPYQLVLVISDFFSELPFATVCFFSLGALSLVWYALVFASGELLVLRSRTKNICMSVALLGMVLVSFFVNIPVTPQSNSMYVAVYPYSRTAIAVCGQQKILISDFYSVGQVVKFTTDQRVREIDYAIVTANASVENVSTVCDLLNVKELYVPQDKDFDPALYELELSKEVGAFNEMEFSGVKVVFYTTGLNYYGLSISGANGTTLIPYTSSKAVSDFFKTYFVSVSNPDFLISSPQNYDCNVYFNTLGRECNTNYQGKQINDCYVYSL